MWANGTLWSACAERLCRHPSKRLRRVCVFSELSEREIVCIRLRTCASGAIRGSCGEIMCAPALFAWAESMCAMDYVDGRGAMIISTRAPFEALAPRECVLWIVWLRDCVRLCMWASGDPPRRLRREYVSTGLCGWERCRDDIYTCTLRSACSESVCALNCLNARFVWGYACGRVVPFEALAPRVCVHFSRRLRRDYVCTCTLRGAWAENMCALNYVDGCVRLSIWVDALRGLEIFGLKLDC